MVLFFGAACASVVCAPRIGIGLDQELSMPEDSFVLKFFIYMKVMTSVGKS
jgi:Niemann-Pick C1 protein